MWSSAAGGDIPSSDMFSSTIRKSSTGSRRFSKTIHPKELRFHDVQSLIEQRPPPATERTESKITADTDHRLNVRRRLWTEGGESCRPLSIHPP